MFPIDAGAFEVGQCLHVAEAGSDCSRGADRLVCVLHFSDESVLAMEVLVDREGVFIWGVETRDDCGDFFGAHTAVLVFEVVKDFGGRTVLDVTVLVANLGDDCLWDSGLDILEEGSAVPHVAGKILLLNGVLVVCEGVLADRPTVRVGEDAGVGDDGACGKRGVEGCNGGVVAGVDA